MERYVTHIEEFLDTSSFQEYFSEYLKVTSTIELRARFQSDTLIVYPVLRDWYISDPSIEFIWKGKYAITIEDYLSISNKRKVKNTDFTITL